jgi:hypothetical protein
MADTSATGDFEPMLLLYSPSGTYLQGWWNQSVASINYPVEESGTYTVLASDGDSNETGSYNIYFAHMPGSNEHGELINDVVHQGQIDLGDLDTYTFFANSGDSIQVTMTDTSVTGDMEPQLQLYSPSGGIINFGTANWRDSVMTISYTAEDTGTYTVLATDAESNEIGSYEIIYENRWDPSGIGSSSIYTKYDLSCLSDNLIRDLFSYRQKGIQELKCYLTLQLSATNSIG